MKKLNILYEDKYILIINKPAKILSVSTNNEKEKTIFHKVYEYIKKKNKNNKVFIVHRLDYDTSGILVFAKDENVKYMLQNNWNSVIRSYVAVVEGNVEKQRGTIKSYLKETSTLLTYSTNKKDGKLAITDYNKVLSNNLYTLLEINIKTGRKNQIRVHMKDLGHPIIGDKKYNSNVNPINRLALHANYIKFTHPITKNNIEIDIDIPDSFINLFK